MHFFKFICVALLSLFVALTPVQGSAENKKKPQPIEWLQKKIELKETKNLHKKFVVKEGILMSLDREASGLWICGNGTCSCDYRVFDCTEGSEICAKGSDGQPDATCSEGICSCPQGGIPGTGTGRPAPAEFLTSN